MERASLGSRLKARAAPALLTLVVLAIIGLAIAHQLSNARCFVLTGPVVCRVETAEPLVALSFDDGPTEAGLAAVLPVLEQYDAHATFFVVGREASARPELLATLAQAGHEVGNHSYSHQRMVLRPQAFYDAEIAGTQTVLAQAGVASGLFRPPYGKKLLGLPASVARHRLRLIMWDVEDPKTGDPDRFAREVLAEVRPGSIILLHPMYASNETARRALPQILAGLRARGYRAVTVGSLLAAERR